MKKIIHKLRKRPEAERRHILNLLMIIVVIIMLVLWAFSLGRSFSNTDAKIKMEQDLKPFTVLKDNVVGGYNSVSDNNSNQ